MGAHLTGALLALFSALVYGSADFFGGVATKRLSAYAVLSSAALLGIVPMVVLGMVFGEGLPGPQQLFWAVLAGSAGMVGLAILYHGLAHGNVAIVSAVSGVVSAALPVVVSTIFINPPQMRHFLGFLIALAGIWFVTHNLSDEHHVVKTGWKTDLAKGFLAGIFFGVFFISLAQIPQQNIFFPLAIAKTASFAIGFFYTITRKIKMPHIAKNPNIILAGVLDPAANALYVVATHFTRLDIAAVLSSMYPAGTILLAFFLSKAPIYKIQWVGIGFCLVATVLMMS
jgi:drug/metabolite transporter (DMT)-like permease